MGKRLKLKLSRMIPYFQSCHNKDPSTLPSNPAPPFLRLSPSVNPSSINRHVSSAFSCGSCASKSDVVITTATTTSAAAAAKRHDVCVREPDRTGSPPPPPPTVPEFHWGREEKWHVVAKIPGDDGDTTAPRRKIYSSSSASDHNNCIPSPVIDMENEKKKKKKKKQKKKRRGGRKKKIRIRISTSSAAADEEEEEEESGLFSSQEEEEGTAGELSPILINNSHNNSNNRTLCKPNSYYKSKKHTASSRRRGPEEQARVSGFRGWCGGVEGKVRESYAVVKRSEDPREDFKRSMMEMILENQMFEERDLEQLLVCFLSLNSTRHHRVIVQAFAEIWQALFVSSSSTSFSVNSTCNDTVSFAV